MADSTTSGDKVPKTKNPSDEADSDLDTTRTTADKWIEPDTYETRIGEFLTVNYEAGEAQVAGGIVALIDEQRDYTVLSREQLEAEPHFLLVAGYAPLQVRPHNEGRYILYMFADGEEGPELIAQSRPITVKQWKRGQWDDELQDDSDPPYLTLGANVARIEGRIEFDPGQAAIGYYELPEEYPADAFVCMVRADLKDERVLYNREAALEYQPLTGKLMDDAAFVLNAPGTYVLRLFPCNLPGCKYVAESQQFTVLNP